MSLRIDAFRSQNAGRCRAQRCRAPIFFVATEASQGKTSIPLDWDPTPAGNVVLIEGLWGELLARVLGPKANRPDSVATYMPHHASCPARALWARRKERADGKT